MAMRLCMARRGWGQLRHPQAVDPVPLMPQYMPHDTKYTHRECVAEACHLIGTLDACTESSPFAR